MRAWRLSLILYLGLYLYESRHASTSAPGLSLVVHFIYRIRKNVNVDVFLTTLLCVLRFLHQIMGVYCVTTDSGSKNKGPHILRKAELRLISWL